MQKKLYICCPKNLQPILRAETEVRYKDRYLFTENLEEADLIYSFGEPTAEMEREIIKANRNGIPIVYMNEKFRNEEVYEALLSNKKEIKIVTKEKSKVKER